MLSLVLAASIAIFGGSDAPPPYTVDQFGITLPAGDTFPPVEEPTEEPTAPVTPTPIHCEPPFVPGWLDENGNPTGCVNNGVIIDDPEPTPNPTTSLPPNHEDPGDGDDDPTEEPTPWTPTPSPSSPQPSVPLEPASPSSPTPSSPVPSPSSVPASVSSSTSSTSTTASSRSAENTSSVEPVKTPQDELASTGSSSLAGPILLGLGFTLAGAYLLRRSRLGKN